MKQMKGIVALLLALAMCLSLLSVSVWAAEDPLSAEEASSDVSSALVSTEVGEVPEVEIPAGEEASLEQSCEETEPKKENDCGEANTTEKKSSSESESGKTDTDPDGGEKEELETQDVDPYASARVISLNTTISDRVDRRDDDEYEDEDDEWNYNHYYQFSLPQDGAVSFTLSHEYINDYDPYCKLSLINQKRETITESYFESDQPSSTTSAIGLSAGTYYVVVKCYYSDVQYELKVNYNTTDVWEREENNAFYYANEICVNQETFGNIMEKDDKDYYKVQLDSSGPLSLSFTHTYIDSDSDYWEATLYDGDQKYLDRYSFKGNDGKTVKTTEIGLTAGTYYIVVETAAKYYGHGDYSNETYHFCLNYTASNAWEKEFNESYYTATPMSLNIMESGSIRAEDDADYFRFSTEEDGYITIDFQHDYVDSSQYYWALFLYDADEKAMVGYKYMGSNANKLTSAKIGIPAGTYYVIIASYSYEYNWSWISDTYRFKVNFTASKQWETEFNHSFYTADPIEAGKTYHGSLMTEDDVDYYCINMKKKGTIAITFKHPFIDSEDYYWEYDLYKADETWIQGYYQSGDEQSFTGAKVTLGSGKYYLRVKHCDDNAYSGQDYSISYKHAHSYTKKVTKKPTLASKGTAKYTCKECGKSYTKTLPKLKPAPVTGIDADRVRNSSDHELYVIWDVGKKADGYVVQASLNRDFSGRKSVALKGRKNNDVGLLLKKSGYYYIRVRAYQKYKGKTYYSNWTVYEYKVYVE